MSLFFFYALDMWVFCFVFSFWLFGLCGFVPFLLLWLCEPVPCWWSVPLFGSSGPCCRLVLSRRRRFLVLWRRFRRFLALRRLVWFSSVPPHRRGSSSSGLGEFVLLCALFFFFFSFLPFVLLLLR